MVLELTAWATRTEGCRIYRFGASKILQALPYFFLWLGAFDLGLDSEKHGCWVTPTMFLPPGQPAAAWTSVPQSSWNRIWDLRAKGLRVGFRVKVLGS